MEVNELLNISAEVGYIASFLIGYYLREIKRDTEAILMQLRGSGGVGAKGVSS